MPKKKGYTKTKRAFARQYGAKEGKRVFYATLNSKPALRKKLTGSTKKIRRPKKKRR